VVAVFGAGQGLASPPTREDAAHRERFAADLRAAPAAESSAAGRAAALGRAYKAEPDPDVRRLVFDHIPAPPDPALDRFLADVLAADADAGIRGMAATALGTDGCLPALGKAAATDPVTEFRVGCVAGKGTARRAATFAIAELAARHTRRNRSRLRMPRSLGLGESVYVYLAGQQEAEEVHLLVHAGLVDAQQD
jgi:hypothetical protein